MQFFQLARLGASLLASVILAQSGLPLREIGAYEVLLYLSTTVTFFWLNGLLQGLPPVYSTANEEERRQLIFQSFWIFSALAAALAILLSAGRNGLVPLFSGHEKIEYLSLFCWYLVFHLPTFPVEYYYLLREKPIGLIGWGTLQFLLHIGAIGLPLALGGNLEQALYCLVITAAGRWLWAFWLAFRWGSIRPNPSLVRRYWWFSFPLMLNSILGNAIVLFDAWLAGWYFSDASMFAIYRYGSRELPLSMALATALGMAMIPRITADPVGGLEELKRRGRRLFHLVFPLTIVLVVVTPEVFPLIFTNALAEAAPLFKIYLLLTVSRLLLPNTVVLALGKPRVIFYNSLLELALKIILGFVLIIHSGLHGLAWSAVGAFFFEKLALIWWLERKENIRTRDWLDVSVYLKYVLVLFLVFCLRSCFP